MIDLDDYPVLTQNSEEFLNRRQLLDYRSEREECLRWLLTFGKNQTKPSAMPQEQSNLGRIGWTAFTDSFGNRKEGIR